jgi:hypothetical protein
MTGVRVLGAVVLAAASIVATPSISAAGEDVRPAISIPAGELVPIITENGNPYAQGSYAIGTLRLEYTVVGYTFPSGPFATFDLGLRTVSKSGPSTVYPAALSLWQSGSTNLELTAAPDSFNIAAHPWESSASVAISIPAGVSLDPALNTDGTTLVANLQLSSNGGSRLGAPSSIQVKIRLVHPSACVRMYTFLSDMDLDAVISDMTLTYGTSQGNLNRILNASPSTQVRHNILLVNTCPDDETVDLAISMDPRFTFGPNGAPANAVFVYSTAGELVPGAIDLASMTQQDALGKVLQVLDLELPAGHTVLVSSHLRLDNDTYNKLNIGASPFVFGAATYEPGGAFLLLHGQTTPNPASASVSFSLVPNGNPGGTSTRR